MSWIRWASALAACLALIFLCSCSGSSSQISITLTTPNAVLTVDEGGTLQFTAAVGGDTKNEGVKWCLTSTEAGCFGVSKQSNCSGTGTLLGNCGTLSNNTSFTVTYTAPAIASTTASTTITLTAISNADPGVTKTATIIVVPPPLFTVTTCNPPSPPNGTPCVLPNGANGVPYTQTISFTGGVSPYMLSNTGLPACLKLVYSTTSGTATINGTPCGSGTTTFNVTVTDSGGAVPVTQSYQITVTPPPTLSITTTSLPPGVYGVPYSTTIVADGGVAPLTFTVTPTPAGSLPAGEIAGLPPGLSVNTTTGQISGTPTQQAITYPATYSIEVQVKDSSLPAPGQVAPATPLMLSITIEPPTPLSITTSGPDLAAGMTATGYNVGLTATGGVAPYTWSIVHGQLPAGLRIDSSGVISGTPILVGTSTFTVQVADSESIPATSTKQFTIQITAGTKNNTLLSGQYTFIFNGFDKNGSVTIVGSLTTDGNGNITLGSESVSRVSSFVTGAAVTGTYSIDSSGDGRGTMELIATIGTTQPLTVTTDYHLVLDSNGEARFFQDNSTATNTDTLQTHGEGILKPVSGSPFSASSFSGDYSFLFAGQDSSQKRAALAGTVHATSSGGLVPATGDLNDAGTFDGGSSPPQAFSMNGSYSLVSSTNQGALTLTFAPSTTTPQITLQFIFYFVSPSDLVFVECDVNSTPPSPANSCETGTPAGFRLGGEMLLQQPTTVFNQTVLAGSSVASGIANNGGNSDIFIGFLNAPICNSSNSISLDYDENNGGTVTSPSFSGTCSVDTSGHVAFTGLGSAVASTRLAAAYLTGPGSGFLIGSDSNVTTGTLEQQSGAPFADASIIGGYTLSAPYIAEPSVPNVIGQVAFDGLGDIVQTDSSGDTVSQIDEIDAPATSAPNLAQPLSASFSTLASDGRGTMLANSPVPAGFPTNSIFYIVSANGIRILPTDSGNQHPNLILLDH